MFSEASHIIHEAFSASRPFAAFRNPGERSLTIVIQHDQQLHRMKELQGSGFVFAPFHSEKPAILLRPDTVKQIELEEVPKVEEQVFVQPAESTVERLRYLDLVHRARLAIRQGPLRKVVLSRKLEVDREVDPIATYQAVLGSYPGAYCYLWYHPAVGTWLGASPELLLSLQGDTFRTVSLAGTLPFMAGQTPAWTEKEREEQKLVTEFIEEALDGQVASIRISEVRDMRAGQLVHLLSTISGEAGKASLHQLLSALHPTPAVCGLPRAESLEFLVKNEGYDRSFYTGYLGMLQMEAAGPKARFFVNLRCLSLHAAKAAIYVGGGITASSIAEAEWEETRYKAGTMLRSLFYSSK